MNGHHHARAPQWARSTRWNIVRRRAIACLVGATVSTPCFALAAARWRDAPYDYVVVNQPTADVLRAFGANTGLRVAVAHDVTGVVHGSPDAATAGGFLDAITRENGLDWYFDGSVLSVSPQNDEQSASVRLNGETFVQARKRLAQLGFLDPRYRLTLQDDATSVLVAGPPAYVDAVRGAIESGGQSPGAAQGGTDLVIYRGATATHVTTH